MREDKGNYEADLSPLSHVIARDGFVVSVQIHLEGGGWILEVIDEKDNITIWDETFESDREALEELLTTIDDEGLRSLVASEARGDE